jgi:hypothetical protein
MFEGSGGYVFLPGVAGGRPGAFLFDTGSPDLFLLNRHVVTLDSAHHAGTEITPLGRTIDVYANRNIGPVIVRNAIYPNVGEVKSGDLRGIEQRVRFDFLGLAGLPLMKDMIFKIDYSQRRLTLFELLPSGAPVVAPFAAGDVVATLPFTTPHSNQPQVDLSVAGTTIPATFDTGSLGALTLTDSTRRALEAAGVLHIAKDSVTLDRASVDSASLTIPVASVTTGATNQLTIGTRFFAVHPTVWNFRAHKITLLRATAKP